jgi:hypothetical protein
VRGLILPHTAGMDRMAEALASTSHTDPKTPEVDPAPAVVDTASRSSGVHLWSGARVEHMAGREYSAPVCPSAGSYRPAASRIYGGPGDGVGGVGDHLSTPLPLRLTGGRVVMQDLDKMVEDALACPCVADMKQVSRTRPESYPLSTVNTGALHHQCDDDTGRTNPAQRIWW